MRIASPLVAASIVLAASSARADDTYGPQRPPGKDSVVVHVKPESLTSRVDIYGREPAGDFAWLCTAPCDATVTPRTNLAVQVGATETARASLRDHGGSEVDLVVGPPSSTQKKVGWVLLVGGAVTGIGAGAFYAGFANTGDGASRSDAPVSISGKAIGLLVAVPLALVAFGLLAAGTTVLATTTDAPSITIRRSPAPSSAPRQGRAPSTPAGT